MKTFRKKLVIPFIIFWRAGAYIFLSAVKNNKNSFMKPFFFGKAVYSGRELLGNYLLPKSDVDTIAFYT